MRINIVTEFFYPYKTSTQKIMTQLAEDLVRQGLEVNVLTTDGSYREKRRKVLKNEIYNGINIKRFWTIKGDHENKLIKIINYLIFSIKIFIYLLIRKDYDNNLFVSNPSFVAYIGYLINKIKGKKYIFLVHDILPDVAIKLNIIKSDGIISKLLKFVSKRILRGATKIIVIGEDMKRIIVSEGIENERVVVITNWADSVANYEENVEEEFYSKYNMKKKFNVIYTGNISKVHSIDTILEVAKILGSYNDILFTFVGDGSMKDHIKSIIEETNLNNIQLYGYMYGDEYNKILNCADICISTLQKGIEGLGVPSKTYTYMAVSKPIIAIMDKYSEIGSMVNENNIGKQFEVNSSVDIANYIISLKNDKNEYEAIRMNVRKLFKENYERKKVTKEFYNLLISL